MSNNHHSPSEVEAAFKRAPQILRRLKEEGLSSPRFELYEDASGRLILGEEGTVTSGQYRLASELIYSERQDFCYACLQETVPSHTHDIAIRFCCGLVQASGGHRGG